MGFIYKPKKARLFYMRDNFFLKKTILHQHFCPLISLFIAWLHDFEKGVERILTFMHQVMRILTYIYCMSVFKIFFFYKVIKDVGWCGSVDNK